LASLDLGSPGLIDCVGFSGPTIEQFVLERAGYPAAVALIFAQALQRCMASGDRPAKLLDHLSPTSPLGSPTSLASAPPAIHLDYRYLLRLVSPKSQRLSVACWRRYAGGLGWQRRCGPMPLERFVARFLEVPAPPLSAGMPALKRDGVCPRGASS
jgi:hypothetical protein